MMPQGTNNLAIKFLVLYLFKFENMHIIYWKWIRVWFVKILKLYAMFNILLKKELLDNKALVLITI